VSAYLKDVLGESAVVVVIATEPHARAFAQALTGSDGGVESALDSSGRLILVDAPATLAKLVVGGKVNAEAFEREVGTMIRAAGRGGSTVHAYGEMVDLLWQEGDVAGAIELETLWNKLIAELQFSLLCAYHTAAIDVPEHEHALREVCQLHSSVSAGPGSGLRLAPSAEAVTEASREFLPHPDAPRAARRFLEAALEDCGHSETLIDDARLVISELVTNAVMHARSPLAVSVLSGQSKVRLAVRDKSPMRPMLRPTTPGAVPRHGLQIVGVLSSNWGVQPTPDGKSAWAELRPASPE
jgi:hypothetical protein